MNNGQLMLLADLSSKSEKIDIILGENPVRRNYDYNSSQDLADTKSIKRVKTESDSDSYTITMVKPTILGETSHDDLVDEANIEAMDEVLNVNSNDVDLNVNSNDVVPNVNSNDVDRSQPNPFGVLYKNFVHEGSTTFLTVDNEHQVNEEVFGFSLIKALLNRDQSIVTVEVLVSEYLLFQAQYRQELIKHAGWLEFFFEFSKVIKTKASSVLKAVHVLNKIRLLNQPPPHCNNVTQVVNGGQRYIQEITPLFQHHAWRTDEYSLNMLRKIIDDDKDTTKSAKATIGQVIKCLLFNTISDIDLLMLFHLSASVERNDVRYQRAAAK